MLPCTAAKGKVSSTLAKRADAPETDQGRTWRDDEPQCLTQPPHRAHAAQADRAERRSERSMGISSHTRHRKKSCRFARCSRGLDEKSRASGSGTCIEQAKGCTTPTGTAGAVHTSGGTTSAAEAD